MNKFKLQTIDYYIIKKFLGTFFFSIVLIISIAVVFDLSEKLDDFMENNAPVRAVIFDYYANFVPYFANLFSYLFTFIAVIFFTSKMAYNTEIIAILSAGVSFRRMLVPYFVSAALIAAFSFVLTNYVIPHANAERFEFEEVYYHGGKKSSSKAHNIHKQIEPGLFVYLERYYTTSNQGHKFSLEKYEEGKLVSKLISRTIIWDTTVGKWTINDYYIRHIDGLEETIEKGRKLDTVLNMKPSDFAVRANVVEAMNLGELNDYLRELKMQGAPNIEIAQIEKSKRFAYPFSTFILTLLGVSVSSRKVRGGMGGHLGFGVAMSFSFIFFMQFSSQFAIGGLISPTLAVWIPNLMFLFLSLVLYKLTPK